VAPVSGLEVEIRRKRFPAVGDAQSHEALRDVAFKVRSDEFVCLTGPSGCGKTTLLNIVAGLDRDYDGRLALPVPQGRAEPVIGYVFQEPRLLPWYTVIENIELVLPRDRADRGLVDELLTAAGLEPFRAVYPQRLSLGMSRRVALVRAFAVEPDLLLLDEPFVSLDEPTAQRLRVLLLDILARRPTTVLFVTHNLREALFLAERILLLSPAPGTLVADVPVPLARAERGDSSALEACRTKLLAERPAMARALAGMEETKG
jgi:NitT/TauT family transport system ATP-binding protein